jgi:hypothetical protein
MLRMSWVGLSALAQPRLTKGGQPYLETRGIFGSQVSALGNQVRMIRYRCGYGEIQVLNLYPNLRTCIWYLTAETRDLKMYSPANHPVSGFPLSADSLPWVGLSALAQPRLTKGGQPYR